MIPRNEIIMNMGTADMSNKTLLIEVSKYVDVCLSEIDTAIRKGVDGWLEPFFAWVLGLKKYIPAGFNPVPRNPTYKTRQLVLGLNFDHVTKQTLDAPKKINTKILISNTSEIKQIIHKLGGCVSVSIIAECSDRTVRDWDKLTKRGTQGYIPKRYIYKISKFARDYNIDLSREYLESFLPI